MNVDNQGPRELQPFAFTVGGPGDFRPLPEEPVEEKKNPKDESAPEPALIEKPDESKNEVVRVTPAALSKKKENLQPAPKLSPVSPVVPKVE